MLATGRKWDGKFVVRPGSSKHPDKAFVLSRYVRALCMCAFPRCNQEKICVAFSRLFLESFIRPACLLRMEAPGSSPSCGRQHLAKWVTPAAKPHDHSNWRLWLALRLTLSRGCFFVWCVPFFAGWQVRACGGHVRARYPLPDRRRRHHTVRAAAGGHQAPALPWLARRVLYATWPGLRVGALAGRFN